MTIRWSMFFLPNWCCPTLTSQVRKVVKNKLDRRDEYIFLQRPEKKRNSNQIKMKSFNLVSPALEDSVLDRCVTVKSFVLVRSNWTKNDEEKRKTKTSIQQTHWDQLLRLHFHWNWCNNNQEYKYHFLNLESRRKILKNESNIVFIYLIKKWMLSEITTCVRLKNETTWKRNFCWILFDFYSSQTELFDKFRNGH